MINYGKHQIFIGGEKQDVIGFISAFLDKIENVEGYQIRIMLHVNDNDDIIRTNPRSYAFRKITNTIVQSSNAYESSNLFIARAV